LHVIGPRRTHIVGALLIALGATTAGVGVANTPSRVAHHEGGAGSAGIPPRIRRMLLTDARRTAALQGDPAPFDIEAVRSTHAKAERLEHGRFEPPGPGAAVYVVAMRGRFLCSTCTYPSGAKAPRGSVITLETLAATMRGIGFLLGRRYPALRTIGTPIRIG
jgi:hypothetical protein